MTRTPLTEELERLIRSEVTLRQRVSILRDYRSRGISRGEVQEALESLRAEARDESEEDRIPEILDIVSGFCSGKDAVWEG